VPFRYSMPEVLEMAVETERSGKQFYDAVAAETADPKLKELLSFLAAEEDRHIAAFQQLARDVKERPEDLPYNWEEAALYLDAITHSRYFLGKGKALDLAKSSKTAAEALTHAIGFEKETLLFYAEVLNMVAERNRPTVQRLIAEEKSHVVRLTQLREKTA
jgi:rubrerythrin